MLFLIIFSFIYISDSENDDSCGGHLWRMLASLSHLFHRYIILPTNNKLRIHSRGVPSVLLVGNEQFHVQSNHLLLDELEVRITCAFEHLQLALMCKLTYTII